MQNIFDWSGGRQEPMRTKNNPSEKDYRSCKATFFSSMSGYSTPKEAMVSTLISPPLKFLEKNIKVLNLAEHDFLGDLRCVYLYSSEKADKNIYLSTDKVKSLY